MGQSDAQLFPTLARAAERRVGDFNAQELANTAWAFAKVDRTDVVLIGILAGMANQNIGDIMGDFRAQELDILWALASVGQFDEQLFAALARLCSRKSHRRRSAALANAVNSCTSEWPTFANAHAVLARPCGLNSLTCCSAALANTVNSCVSDWSAFANAHAMLARS